MLTLVTGANYTYFSYLKQLLNNAIKISNDKNIQIRIIVYNLGLADIQLDEIKSFPYVILENFDFYKYPEHVSLEKYNGINCTYAWKPIIIYEVCGKYGGLVHWMDTRNLYSDFNNLIKILSNNYIYIPMSSGNVERWTHPTTLKYMGGYKYRSYQCRNAAIFGINCNIKWCKEFVKEWKDLALIKECICPKHYKYHEKYNFKLINNYINLSSHNLLKI